MNQERTVYVSTLMVNRAFTRAAFVLKNRPAFLAGKLCPVGGKLEKGETPRQAAAREHGEETLVLKHEEDWTPYARLERDDAVMHCFYTVTDDVEQCRTNTAEENWEKVYVLDIQRVLVAATTPVEGSALPFLEDASWVSEDLAALLGLVLRARTQRGFTVIDARTHA
jgi:ADP-ribose pyrophosphatase YjhB (NUDIX family)